MLTVISWTSFVVGALIGLVLVLSSTGVIGRTVPLLGICGTMLLFIGYVCRQLLTTNRRVDDLEKRLAAISHLEA